jgi:hypothetical protein
MDLGNKNIKMEIFIKVSFSKVRNKDRESLHG